jgi:SAM-dependent methyltransferase
MFIVDLVLLAILIFALLLFITAVVSILSGSPYVPSNRATIERMLKEAKLKKNQLVYDLGCGDGRLLIKAEKKYRIKGIGYEAAPIPYLLALGNKLFHRSKAKIYLGDFMKVNLENAQVIFLYLGPELQRKLAPKIKKECQPGALIVANSFHLPGLKPIKTIKEDKKARTKTIHIYKLSAK